MRYAVSTELYVWATGEIRLSTVSSVIVTLQSHSDRDESSFEIAFLLFVQHKTQCIGQGMILVLKSEGEPCLRRFGILHALAYI